MKLFTATIGTILCVLMLPLGVQGQQILRQRPPEGCGCTPRTVAPAPLMEPGAYAGMPDTHAPVEVFYGPEVASIMKDGLLLHVNLLLLHVLENGRNSSGLSKEEENAISFELRTALTYPKENPSTYYMPDPLTGEKGKGAEVRIDNYPMTYLLVRLLEEPLAYPSITQYLIEEGANLQVENENHQSLLRLVRKKWSEKALQEQEISRTKVLVLLEAAQK